MKKEMRELYVEGLATHDGPVSCVTAREGWGEALIGVRAAGLLSREMPNWGADVVHETEGHTAGGVMRESSVDPTRSEIQGMYGIFMRENREGPSPTRPVDHWVGRPGNAETVSLGWTGMGSRMVP